MRFHSAKSRINLTVACGLTVLFAATLVAQSEHPVTGRRISGVMSVSGADWLERSEREMEELPETALDKIGLQPGMTVADVGVGSGYFTLRMAKRIGPGGKIYAVDVQPEMLTILRGRLKQAKITNVEPVLGSESDPRLPKNALDLILMVDVYHELSHPQKMLQKMRASLKNNGRLVLLEYRKEDPHIPIRADHKMSVEEARLEVEAEGFKLEKVHGDLPRQHIFVFRKDIQ